MKFMNLKKKLAPVLMGGALAVATAVPVFASDADNILYQHWKFYDKHCRKDPSGRTSNHGSSSPCWIWYQSI